MDCEPGAVVGRCADDGLRRGTGRLELSATGSDMRRCCKSCILWLFDINRDVCRVRGGLERLHGDLCREPRLGDRHRSYVGLLVPPDVVRPRGLGRPPTF